MKEYSGPKVDKLTYQTTDYMGGYTVSHVIDFINNQYLKNAFTPDEGEPELTVYNIFTDEQEKIFIDACYSYGLFNLAPKYVTNEIIFDGGGWSLAILYEDGSSKISTGSNAGPVRTFNKLATYFYDICGERVVGNVPEFYAVPPNISYSFRYNTGLGDGSTNAFVNVKRANYKWNKFDLATIDLYDLNKEIDNLFISGFEYKMVLYTANYHHTEKFNKIVVKSFDYDNLLANEEVVYEGKWFGQIEFELKMNKIYVYTLSYKDGDFVEYTFNTLCKDDKINYGEYHYSVYNVGNAKLFINNDNTFTFESFYYYDTRNEVTSINGNYSIDGNSIILNIDDKAIVFDIYPHNLLINKELTTLDLTKYLYDNQNINYSFWS